MWPRSTALVCLGLVCLASLLFFTASQAQMFEEIASQVGIGDAGTVAAAFWYDCDADGDLDMLETRRFWEPMVLYVNNGGQFTAQTNIGLPTEADGQTTIPMDFDADHDLDIFACAYHTNAQLLVNENGVFQDRTSQYGLLVTTGVRDMAWLDLEHDGWLDLLIGHYTEGWRLYHNDGGTHFTDITESSQLPSTDFHRFCEGDINLDGNEDLFLCRIDQSDRFYLNVGNGIFEDHTVSAGLSDVESRGGAEFADFNGDKYPDLLVEDLDHHTIYFNDQDGTFTEITVHGTETDFFAQPYPYAVQYAVADYDMDGDLDFYVSRQGSSFDTPNQLFRNDSLIGNEIWFTDMAAEYGLGIMLDNYALWGDYDGDGDLDLFVTTLNSANRLYRNNVNDNTALNNRLEVKVLGPSGAQDSWHTRVEVYPAGENIALAAAELNQSNVNCNGLNSYFVIDGAAAYDVCIYFQDGTEMCAGDYPNLSGVIPAEVGHVLTVVEGSTNGAAPPESSLPDDLQLAAAYPNPFNAVTTIRYQLPEAGKARMSVFAVDGRWVADLVNAELTAGEHTVTWNAANESSGIYFVCLLAGKAAAQQKVVLLK